MTIKGAVAAGPPIFVLSNLRSGSTLLRYMLDTHPELCCAAEVRAAELCELYLTAWNLTVGKTLLGAAPAEVRDRGYRETRGMVETFMGEYCRRKGKARWCEKTPINLDRFDAIDAVFPDAQYICLHRHGVDAIESLRRINESTRTDMTQRLEWYIEMWCRRTERLIAIERCLPGRVISLRYENILEDAETELERVFEFVGVAQVAGLVEETFRSKHDRGPGDAIIRFSDKLEADHVGGQLSEDWKSAPEELRRRLLADLDRLGYAA